jgi:hypothetical protein
MSSVKVFNKDGRRRNWELKRAYSEGKIKGTQRHEPKVSKQERRRFKPREILEEFNEEQVEEENNIA